MNNLQKNHTVESWEVGRLKPYSNNAKIHDPIQVTKIARAIDKFGFDQPIAVDKNGVIIKGHGRRLAAMELGMKYVPVIVRDDLDEDEVKAARLADNRVAKTEDDAEMLQKELADLSDATIDLSLTGFDDNELDFLSSSNLDDMDMDTLIDDLDDASKKHDEEVDQKTEDVKNRGVSLKEAFGFSSVTSEQARVINQFMAQLENETGQSGADALSQFVNEFMK